MYIKKAFQVYQKQIASISNARNKCIKKKQTMPEKYSLLSGHIIFMNENSLFRAAVVRSLTGDSNIMRMTLKHTGIGDTGEFSIMQLFNIGCTAIPHTCTQASGQLINHLIQSSLKGHGLQCLPEQASSHHLYYFGNNDL